MNRAIVVGGMLTAVAGASLFSGSATPILYGASEATSQTVGSSVTGLLLTVGGLFTSAFQLFKSGGNRKVIEDMLGKFTDSKQTVEVITAEVALVALAGLCIKAGDTANLTKVGELSASMLAKKA